VRLFVYYRNKGYFDAHVSYSLHESKQSSEEWQKVSEKNNRLPPTNRVPYPSVEDTVVFHIKEGKPYKVAGFTFEGFEKLPMDLQTKLTENIGIKQNSQYSEEAVIRESVRAKEILSESGYPFLSLIYTDVPEDTLRKTVTISLKFKTGPRVRVGGSKIIYDTAYSKYGYVEDQVIRRQISMDSGTWYKNSNTIISQRDLGRLGTFQYQSITLDTSAFAGLPDSARDGTILPVIINLRMRNSIEIVGYPIFGVNSFYQFILGLGASYSNHNVGNVADNFTTQASYQFYPITEHRVALGSEFTFPSFPIFSWKNVPLILSGNFTYSDQHSSSGALQYLERTGNLSAGTNVQLSSDPSLIASWSPKGLLQYITRDYRDSSIFGGHVDTTIKPQFNVIGSSDISYNWTNDPLNPSRGTYVSWSLQYAVPWFSFQALPSAAYLKNTLQFKEFFDLGSIPGRSILGFRIMGGLIALTYPNEPTRDILIENRYYGGGANSLRGWDARTLLVSNNTTPGLPQFGGYKMFETNLEWRYALFNDLSDFSPVHLGIFIDAGNVSDKNVPVALRNFAIALGTGLRYNTIIGAVRIDFGFKLYDPYPR